MAGIKPEPVLGIDDLSIKEGESGDKSKAKLLAVKNRREKDKESVSGGGGESDMSPPPGGGSIHRSGSRPQLDLSGAAIQGNFEERDPTILLPNQSDDISHLALDIGGSLIKLVYFSRHADRNRSMPDKRKRVEERLGMTNGSRRSYPILGGRLHFVKFETSKINECLDFIYSKQLHRGGMDSRYWPETPPGENAVIKATGGGAYKFADLFKERLGVSIEKEDEMNCLVASANFLLKAIRHEAFTHIEGQKEFVQIDHNDLYPYLLVNVGSGVSMIKVDGDGKLERVSGTNVGGGTYWGLGRLLTKCKSFDELLELSQRGDNSTIDMLVGDIYGGLDYNKIGLSASTIASSFGKAISEKKELEDYRPEENQTVWLIRRMANCSKKKGPPLSRCIVESIFSWSINDVLNQNLFKHKVKGIPLTFPSANRYTSSFIQPLVEEIHADLSSNMKLISKAPTCEIISVEPSKKHYNSTDLLYDVKFDIDYDDSSKYKPGYCDLVVLTDVVPKCIDDLSKPNRAYTVAIVKGLSEEDSEKLVIRSSRPIVCQKYRQNNVRKERLFAVFLTNMITNLRISDALDIDPQVANLSIINAVLQANTSGGNCVECSATQSLSSDDTSHPWSGIQCFGLDDSQEAAVLSCITTMRCLHRNTVKLIWGPPGTGKTKTVGVLLFGFLSLKCRTVTCAPTNIAVIQVTRRLFGLVKQSLEYDTYGLGDVVLFGNNERMKVKEEHRDLLDIFFDHRVDVLNKCCAPLTGWKASIESLIFLLEEPEVLYSMYLETNEKEEQENIKDDSKSEDEDSKRKSEREEGKEGLYNDQEPIIQSEDQEDVLNQAGNKDSQCESEQEEGEESICNKKVSFFITLSEAFSRTTEETRQKRNETDDCVLTMEEFLRVCFKFLSEQMRFCIVGLYTHLPTSVLPLEKVKLMIHCLELIQSFASWLLKYPISSEGSQEFLSGFKVRINRLNINNFKTSGEKCLQALKSLHGKFNLPEGSSNCLGNALLIFCTASTSAKLHGTKSFDMLVIDEAAQLKECESAIPLQLSGLRHAILVGDERQLPAMVQSKISEKAEFGRSLFKRLVLLGQKKHLLNIQYRMHPAISSFPNKNFYDNLIMDAPNVKQSSHAKEFLQSPMYGAFSFINVSYGQEELDGSHSLRNMVEVSVACEIVAALSRESATQKRRISVGIISPYKAQVFAIHDIISKKYPNDSQSQFLVTVRSVDGFQGGEDDIIIISTVRCNGRGSVGFLSNLQRTNVALTRARHCLWILGNSQTLINSGSVWKKLVKYAKDRCSIYNCEEDDNLARAISHSLCKHNRLDVLLKNDSFLFRNAKWQMNFSPDFITNLMRITSTETRMATLKLLSKLSTGWRMPHEVKRLKSAIEEGISSELLQLYEVDKRLTLIWSTDTAAKGNERSILQVVKVWDIQPTSEIPKIANHLDAIFKNYTIEKINQCQHKRNEGVSEVPMRWQMDSADVEKHETSVEQFLSKSFSSLSLADKSKAQKRKKRLHKKKLAKKVAAEANKLNPEKTTASLADKSGTSKRKSRRGRGKSKDLDQLELHMSAVTSADTPTTSKPKSRHRKPKNTAKKVSSEFNPVPVYLQKATRSGQHY